MLLRIRAASSEEPQDRPPASRVSPRRSAPIVSIIMRFSCRPSRIPKCCSCSVMRPPWPSLCRRKPQPAGSDPLHYSIPPITLSWTGSSCTRYSFGQHASFLTLLNPFQISTAPWHCLFSRQCPNCSTSSLNHTSILSAAHWTQNTISLRAENYWKDSYAAFQFTRFLSPSGNPHWHFGAFPGVRFLAL